VLLTGVGFDLFYERLQYKEDFAGEPFADVVENRHGVITVTQSGAVYGGGMYDGVFNVDLMDDRNMIVRAFSIGAFHPQPRHVLMIGLASGSWAQVLAHHPQVEKITVVEINPGYLQLIAKHAEVASVLENPKVEIVVDDGRRWLNRNPDARFDVIVMNTTWHWRAHATNLLSVEFLQLVREHLKPGGAALYNTTDSARVQRTACAVFPHVVRVINNVVVSDSPLMPDRQRWRETLESYRINGKPVIDLSRSDHRAELENILGMIDTLASTEYVPRGMEVRSSILRRTEGLRVVTDDNMGTEWDLPAD
jgi:spermidine synthase